jgi:16S rRNA (adenine1518-N6/adenine1519-N6)-dimethyltransferase
MNHRAKKSLGQNFLKSGTILKKIVSVAKVGKTDTVLEIGPGKGALTAVILATGAKVIAIEKDDSLIPILSETFAAEISLGQLTLIHDDVLKIKAEKLGLKNGKWKLVANIPYYITGLIIRQFLEADCKPSGMTILVQREVAKRIVARDEKESILSLSVKLYGTPTYEGTVPRRYFSPAPNVDSAILHIAEIKKVEREKSFAFFTLIKSAFAHKRKTLVHNIGKNYGRENLIAKLSKLGYDEKVRAEDLKLSDWLTLMK